MTAYIHIDLNRQGLLDVNRQGLFEIDVTHENARLSTSMAALNLIHLYFSRARIVSRNIVVEER